MNTIRGLTPENFASDLPRPTWLIDSIIPSRSLTVVISQPNVGKTFFAMEMAIALSTETPFMGRFETKETRTLFIGEDSPADDVYNQFRKLMAGRNLRILGRLDPLFMVKQGANLSSDEGAVAIADAIEYHMTPFVVFDNLREMHDLDEDKSYLMRQITRRLDYIRERTEAALLILHHPRKPAISASFIPLNEMRGSGGLGGKIDGLLGIRYFKRTELYQVVIGKKRAMQMQDWNYRFFVNEDIARFECVDDRTEMEQQILDALADGEEKPVRELIDICAASFEKPPAALEQRVYEALQTLGAHNLVRRVRRGVYEKLDISTLDTEPENEYVPSRKGEAEPRKPNEPDQNRSL